ncbi:hypothetical protein HBH98_005990 [Parastagonospora nodorum]|nr:hypothetical protein HBH52_204130 [Parastagonospora nodorum]KAH4041368.1 hypothetical protein HBI09_021700 [Parastagonospora nodorum]KAH4058077.1 hypothetical protein HBH49_028440 [Parastagonospora nodorum]KAH4133455.1 hypothetical protein HBH47_004040 [Parastagonospora nodorum]KAH4214509.1 hypothetical protein HBI95_008950 [Parastagonospora nodorum]
MWINIEPHRRKANVACDIRTQTLARVIVPRSYDLQVQRWPAILTRAVVLLSAVAINVNANVTCIAVYHYSLKIHREPITVHSKNMSCCFAGRENGWSMRNCRRMAPLPPPPAPSLPRPQTNQDNLSRYWQFAWVQNIGIGPNTAAKIERTTAGSCRAQQRIRAAAETFDVPSRPASFLIDVPRDYTRRQSQEKAATKSTPFDAAESLRLRWLDKTGLLSVHVCWEKLHDGRCVHALASCTHSPFVLQRNKMRSSSHFFSRNGVGVTRT